MKLSRLREGQLSSGREKSLAAAPERIELNHCHCIVLLKTPLAGNPATRSSPGASAAQRRIAPRVMASVQHFSAAAQIVAHTDAIALVSQSIARLYAKAFRLRVFPLPPELRLPRVGVHEIWHERTLKDAPSRCLRETIAQVAHEFDTRVAA